MGKDVELDPAETWRYEAGPVLWDLYQGDKRVAVALDEAEAINLVTCMNAAYKMLKRI